MRHGVIEKLWITKNWSRNMKLSYSAERRDVRMVELKMTITRQTFGHHFHWRSDEMTWRYNLSQRHFVAPLWGGYLYQQEANINAGIRRQEIWKVWIYNTIKDWGSRKEYLQKVKKMFKSLYCLYHLPSLTYPNYFGIEAVITSLRLKISSDWLNLN